MIVYCNIKLQKKNDVVVSLLQWVMLEIKKKQMYLNRIAKRIGKEESDWLLVAILMVLSSYY